MSGFSISPDKLEAVPLDKNLDDKSLTKLFEGKANYDGEKELETGAGKLTFSFDAEGSARIDVFNSADDKDEDGVIGTPPKQENEWQVKMPPQITFDAKQAWLRYRFKAGVKGSVGLKFPVGPLGLDAKVEGQKGVIFADYHTHAPNENAVAAVVSDIPKVRLALNPDDAFELGASEALSYQVYGALTASVALSWSDTLTAGLGALSNVLKSGEIIKLKIAPSFSLSFNVGVRDDFRVVFTKGNSGGVRVAVLKANTRELGIKAGLEVGVEFADSKQVQDALNALWEGITGETVTRINNLLERLASAATFEDLSPTFRPLAQALVKRLGLEDVAQTPARLKEEWEKLQQKVTDKFKEAAKLKAKLGFTYEYLRVSTDETLLLAQLPATVFREQHRALLACDLSGVLAWVQQNPKALERYLRQKTLVRMRSWGFTLGIEPWGIKLSGKDTIKQTRVVQETFNEQNPQDIHQRMAYDGLRSYEGDWNGDIVKWTVDFKAEMKNFSKGKSPTTCEFFYGLSLRWDWGEKSLSESELRKYLDTAALWRVLSPGAVNDAVARVLDKLGKKVDVSLEVTIDHNALRFLLPLVANPSENVVWDGKEASGDRKIDAFGVKALARAMPYNEMFAGRRHINYREQLYAPLWTSYFNSDSRSISSYALDAYEHIDRNGSDVPDYRGLALQEKQGENFKGTFASMIALHQNALGTPGVHRSWNRFVKGLKSLADIVKMQNCLPYENIEQSFNDMAQFFGQTLYVRALGVFLMDCAERYNMVGDPAIKRSLILTFGKDEAVSLGEVR